MDRIGQIAAENFFLDESASSIHTETDAGIDEDKRSSTASAVDDSYLTASDQSDGSMSTLSLSPSVVKPTRPGRAPKIRGPLYLAMMNARPIKSSPLARRTSEPSGAAALPSDEVSDEVENCEADMMLDANGRVYVIDDGASGARPPAAHTRRSISADLERLISEAPSIDNVDGLIGVHDRLEKLTKLGRKKFTSDSGLYDDASSASLSELFQPLALDVIAKVAKTGEQFPFANVRTSSQEHGLTTKTSQRQGWGTVLQAPFSLGYQRVTPEQLSSLVVRLSKLPQRQERAYRRAQKRALDRLQVSEMMERLAASQDYDVADSRRVQSCETGILNSYAWKGYN